MLNLAVNVGYAVGYIGGVMLLVWLVYRLIRWLGIPDDIPTLLGGVDEARRQAALRHGFACPFCQEPVRHGATVCAHCRRDLPGTTSG